MIEQLETLVDAFERRRISRRDLVSALACVVGGAGLASPVIAEARPALPAAPGQPAAPAQAVPPAQATVSLAAQGRTLNHASLAVTDVERSAKFYSTLLGLKEVSRPGNGGINLGLSTGFLGLYRLANPGSVNHICLGVDDFDPDRIAARMKEMGITANVDRNPANRTSGGDQLYFTDPDNTRIQLSANGYQG